MKNWDKKSKGAPAPASKSAPKPPAATVVEPAAPASDAPGTGGTPSEKRPGWAMTLFSGVSKETVLARLQRRNLPRMVKAVDADGENIPVDGVVAGIIVDVVPSPIATIKGSLLWLALVDFTPDGGIRSNGREITFPAVGVIRAALAPGITSDEGKDNGQEKARKAMLEFKGFLLVLTRQPDKLNSKYKKSMGMWDVRVSDGPVDIGVKIH